MLKTFTSSSFNLVTAANNVAALVRASTDLTIQQKADCVEVVLSIADETFEPGRFTIDKSIKAVGANGYTCYVVYFASQNYDRDLLEASVTLSIDIVASSTGTVTPAVSTATVIPGTGSSWVSGAAPSLPARGDISTNFAKLAGISVILPEIIATIDTNNTQTFLNYQVLGSYAYVTSATNYVKATLVNGISSNIPDYTLATLYYNNTAVTSGYSIAGGLVSNIDLYYNLPGSGTLSLVVQTSGNQPWIPTTTFDAFGGVRFTNGSLRGLIIGVSAVSAYPTAYDMTFQASGCTPGTYISEANLVNSLNVSQYLNSGQYFHYNFNGNTANNPVYGYAVPSDVFNATGGAYKDAVYDALLQVNITPALTSQTIPFKIYTPYSFAITGVPIWLQTVLPDSNNYNSIIINWGDGISDSYTVSLSTELYAVHTYDNAGVYTVLVSGVSSTYVQVASAAFTIIDDYTTLNIEDYAETLGLYLKLPYNKSELNIGSNEWAVADNINAAFIKLKANFDYLNKITDSIRKTPDFNLVEWLRDLASYSTWNTRLSGSNTYFNLSGSYAGVIPAASIIDFKSYKNTFSAPDYYNYIAYNNGLLQIRKNNYNNTIVNQLTAVTTNSETLFVYGVDANEQDVYVLASINQGGGKSPVSIYRYSLNNSTVAPVNQIGGNAGTRTDGNNFSITQPPSGIKFYNNNVYVADVGNKCVKVYNSALTHINTIYSSELSAYNILQFDVNTTNSQVYMLGRIIAPNAPVITSVINIPDNDKTIYKVTFNHDGERLNQTQGASANFNIYGVIKNNEGNTTYTYIESIYSNVASAINPKLTTYIKRTDVDYTSFKVKAIGYDGITLSEYSPNQVIPNYVQFPSPYKIFVYNTESDLISTLSIPEVPSTDTIKKILIDPAGIFIYILTSSYIYKYTVNGLFVNKISSPSTTTESIGTFEDIVTGFIDENYYFYVVTDKRVFKFTDIPFTQEIVDRNLVENFYTEASAITINSSEYITDWIYNKALKPLLYNHEVLAKSINEKYVVTLDSNKDLVDFSVRPLTASELINSLSATTSNYVYSNEIVSSAVINRTLDKIYDVQEAILEVLTPEVVNLVPSYTSNVLGRITAASSIEVSGYEPPVPTPEPEPVPEPLPVLFSFASADYVGNLYSNLYNGTSRYGNDYTINFNLINALSTTNLIVTVYEVYAGSANLPDPITIIVKANDVIFFAYTLNYNATQMTIPLSAVLTADSSTLAADGSASTFGAAFEITLSVGAVTTNNIIRPRVKLRTTDGHFYNTTFKNSLMGVTDLSASYITVYNLSGANIPYAGIANNTLGGYLYSNPYAVHNWSINNVVSATNPGINVVPASTDSFTVSAIRVTDGESELVLGLNRTPIDPLTTPSYLLSLVSTSTGAGSKPVGGYVNGTGYYPAGSVIPVFAVATYGTFGRFSQNVTTPPYGILLSGPGTTSSWISGPTFVGSTSPDAGGRIDGEIFVDGNRTVDVAFYHS